MAQKFKAGEMKTRPGVYCRYSNVGSAQTPAAMDGVNAIVMKASWGPAGVVTVHDTANSLRETYGNVEYALQLFRAGASKVYVFRPEGTGGAKGTVAVGTGTVTAKHIGARALSVKIQAKPGDATKKECLVLDGATQVEKVEFSASSTSNELSAMKEALAGSKYVDFAFTADGTATVGEYNLEGGTDPTVATADYLKGFQALEPYRFNVLSTDSVESTINQTLLAYADEAEKVGKLFIAVCGTASTTDFDARCATAKGFNDYKIVHFGSGFMTADGTNDGVNAVNYTAGVIASTPSNQSIVHQVIPHATDVTEKLTNAQYEKAIQSGLLLLSVGPDGQVWYDSGVNTLTNPSAEQDNGWKKIKRAKVRIELFDRIDRVVAPLVGKINCDSDGVAAVIQASMGVINEMTAEKKLYPGGSIMEDPENPRTADSAWFVIAVDDIDAMEKIYLHYQFRYSQNS